MWCKSSRNGCPAFRHKIVTWNRSSAAGRNKCSLTQESDVCCRRRMLLVDQSPAPRVSGPGNIYSVLRIMAGAKEAVDFYVPKTVDTLEDNVDMAILISHNNAEVRKYSAWKKGSDESFIHYLYRMCTEGHTFFDAWLLGAGCIGQVMMTTPNAWNKTGLVPGALLITWGTLLGFWTIWQLKTMYYDRKRDMIKAGTWFDDDSKAHNRKHKTQFQELVGYYLPRGGTKVVAVMMFCMWFGVGVAQILASATNLYSINQTYSLRTYCIIFGATLLPFGLIPNFRKMRVILVIGVFATLYTSVYGLYVAGQKGFAEAHEVHVWPAHTGINGIQPFFNGVAIIFSILDHHNIFAETIEAMQHPRKYFWTYILSFFPLFLMIVPPGIALNLAFAKSGIATAGNWFQLAPMSVSKEVAVWLMNLHNIQAWTLWMTSMGFIWEKLLGTHEKSLWIRLTSRLPYLLAVYLFAVCFPFYSAINSLMNGLVTPLTYYSIPAYAFLRHYKHAANRDATVHPTARKLFGSIGWRSIVVINTVLIAYGIIMCGFTSSMAILNVVKLSNTFGFFPECYGCQAYKPAVKP